MHKGITVENKSDCNQRELYHLLLELKQAELHVKFVTLKASHQFLQRDRFPHSTSKTGVSRFFKPAKKHHVKYGEELDRMA